MSKHNCAEQNLFTAFFIVTRCLSLTPHKYAGWTSHKISVLISAIIIHKDKKKIKQKVNYILFLIAILLLYRKLTGHKNWSLVANRNTLVCPTTHLIYNSIAWSSHSTCTNSVKLETSLPRAQRSDRAQVKKQKTNNVKIQNWWVGPVVHWSANDIWVWAYMNW